ncbi:hypothetical protein FKW77_000474 [Venturia effusa]|uniref:Serine hydrolase domain-containing protein n=1 Tax=Venturia effusa TaxID=50376 RepID=A0A517LRG5_9PEZI|nr:hypothetical protein FKW77_000474 [Venturia effusa]
MPATPGKRMRLLGLHGFGSSAGILKNQLSAIIRETDKSYEYVCVDGPVEAHRGLGLNELQPGPYYSHTAGYTPSELADAAEYIRGHIAQEGPFDGAPGFSQGAAQILAYLLQEQAYRDIEGSEDSGIRFAIFFSSTAPCANDHECYLPLLHSLSSTAVHENTLSIEQRTQVDCTLRSFEAAKRIGVLQPGYDANFFEDDEKIRCVKSMPRILHPALVLQRLKIPTVHVAVEKDFGFMQDMSNLAAGMCEPALRKVLKHSGGHSIPTKSFEVKKVVAAMDWALG